jgi:DmsE family decaheme c-type cytochrome
MKPVSRIVWLGALAGLLLCLGISPASAADAAYVGTDTCKGCHEKVAEGFAQSLHAQAWASVQKFQSSGCEACHGPGSKHAEDPSPATIVSFGKKAPHTAAAKSATCQGCHATNNELAFWDNGKHAANGVACADCHDTHASAVPKVNQPEICFNCHKDVRLEANRQSHHPIIEGKVSCSDCHNPHGSLTHGMLRADTKNLLCFKCHAEKRGPFVFEHPPVEENCSNCHEPHGSRHDKLLTEKEPNLCMNCHDWSRHPGTPYDTRAGMSGTAPSNRFIARGCLNCHNNIHGSNASGTRSLRFIR